MNSPLSLFDESELYGSSAATDDVGLEGVHRWFTGLSRLEERFGAVLRQSIDEVLDGQRTSRFDLRTLEKTEKTYLGTKVEIVARAAFDLGRGKEMDYRIANHDVDAKFTINANWTIPREAMGHICLLMSADDHKSHFRVGLLRISERFLNEGLNGDRKRSVSKAGRAAVRWLIPDGVLPTNILLGLPEHDRNAILPGAHGSQGASGGQARTNELFRRVQERVVDRTTVLTVARQDDSPKRVRDARNHLRADGIIILGHQGDHPRIAKALGLPAPAKGAWVAARLTVHRGSDPRAWVDINGDRYTIFREGDPKTFAPDNY